MNEIIDRKFIYRADKLFTRFNKLLYNATKKSTYLNECNYICEFDSNIKFNIINLFSNEWIAYNKKNKEDKVRTVFKDSILYLNKELNEIIYMDDDSIIYLNKERITNDSKVEFNKLIIDDINLFKENIDEFLKIFKELLDIINIFNKELDLNSNYVPQYCFREIKKNIYTKIEFYKIVKDIVLYKEIKKDGNINYRYDRIENIKILSNLIYHKNMGIMYALKKSKQCENIKNKIYMYNNL